ncbi:uncharacterized protein LOC134808019 [Pan troglodytes]|uniref:uncharacterized protein LOC134808019 n=1 Tax=Pan troglodytes TaxID=9598 RepID=UPI003013CEBC
MTAPSCVAPAPFQPVGGRFRVGTRDRRGLLPGVPATLTSPGMRLDPESPTAARARPSEACLRDPRPRSPLPPRCQVARGSQEEGRERETGGGGWSHRRVPSLGQAGRQAGGGLGRRQRRQRERGDTGRPRRFAPAQAAASAPPAPPLPGSGAHLPALAPGAMQRPTRRPAAARIP